MKHLSIDRFEGVYAYCEDNERKMFAIEKNELPEGAGAGDVIAISDDGTITLDKEETAARKARIAKQYQKLWEK